MSEMRPFREYEPAFAGVGITYCRTPLVLDPAGLKGVDVAVVGAPFDLGTSFRPGARFGPRAIRAAEDVGGPPSRPSMELGLDPFEVLRVVDHGDSDVFPDIDSCHHALQQAIAGVLTAGAIPVVLGGDHSLSLPHLRALAKHFGADGYSVIHFDTHADTEIYDSRTTTPHATPFYRAVDEGVLLGRNLT